MCRYSCCMILTYTTYLHGRPCCLCSHLTHALCDMPPGKPLPIYFSYLCEKFTSTDAAEMAPPIYGLLQLVLKSSLYWCLSHQSVIDLPALVLALLFRRHQGRRSIVPTRTITRTHAHTHTRTHAHTHRQHGPSAAAFLSKGQCRIGRAP